jgi:hypothetical protein
MVRRTYGSIGLGLIVSLLLLCGAARGQQLARLHVEALGMHADRSVAPVGAAIHVTIHVHVREPSASLDNLVLPDLSNLEIIGDERRSHSDATGTDYLETLTLTGLVAGSAHLTPAHLDAIDARNGTPTRFSSNDLTLHIESPGTAPSPLEPAARTAWRILLMGAGLLAGIAVLIALIHLRRRRNESPPPVVSVPPVPAVDPRRTLEHVLLVLRAEPSRERAVELREALREVAGAQYGETLDALFLRLDGVGPALRAALRLAERAAFVPDTRLYSSIDELITAAERVARA